MVQTGLILVTGATGFVGSALIKHLAALPGCTVRGASRQEGELTAETNWTGLLTDVRVLVHAAARVHVMQDRAADPLAEYRRTNVQGTLSLARQAAASGVKRFVFISSVKVNGEQTLPDCPFFASDDPAPQDAYGQSKLEAEQGLRQISDSTGMELVIIRPPLVYGPGVRANFQSLMKAVARGIPLPLGVIDNRRSLVGLDNLVDFIATCINHPDAANQTFLVSDGDDLSTAELVRRLARAMGKSPRLIPVPVWVLKAGAALLGKRDVVQRLCGNLQLDISKARKMLEWNPPVTVDKGLQRAAL